MVPFDPIVNAIKTPDRLEVDKAVLEVVILRIIATLSTDINLRHFIIAFAHVGLEGALSCPLSRLG